eukprot:SAG31_NODE_4971_length_2826_cov_5.968464_1_plen_525_part_00
MAAALCAVFAIACFLGGTAAHEGCPDETAACFGDNECAAILNAQDEAGCCANTLCTDYVTCFWENDPDSGAPNCAPPATEPSVSEPTEEPSVAPAPAPAPAPMEQAQHAAQPQPTQRAGGLHSILHPDIDGKAIWRGVTNPLAQDDASGDACDEESFPDRDHGLICGECKVLVDRFDDYGTCAGYCAAIGRTCTGAWEELADSCVVDWSSGFTRLDDKCIQTWSTSDLICECGAQGVDPRANDPMIERPDDGDSRYSPPDHVPDLKDFPAMLHVQNLPGIDTSSCDNAAEFAAWSARAAAECCDEPGERCISGEIEVCTKACADVVLTMYEACQAYMHGGDVDVHEQSYGSGTPFEVMSSAAVRCVNRKLSKAACREFAISGTIDGAPVSLKLCRTTAESGLAGPFLGPHDFLAPGACTDVRNNMLAIATASCGVTTTLDPEQVDWLVDGAFPNGGDENDCPGGSSKSRACDGYCVSAMCGRASGSPAPVAQPPCDGPRYRMSGEETSFCDYTPVMFGSAAGGH